MDSRFAGVHFDLMLFKSAKHFWVRLDILLPRTMMVHTTDAAPAHSAVMGTGRSVGLTLHTHGPAVRLDGTGNKAN